MSVMLSHRLHVGLLRNADCKLFTPSDQLVIQDRAKDTCKSHVAQSVSLVKKTTGIIVEATFYCSYISFLLIPF